MCTVLIEYFTSQVSCIHTCMHVAVAILLLLPKVPHCFYDVIAVKVQRVHGLLGSEHRVVPRNWCSDHPVKRITPKKTRNCSHERYINDQPIKKMIQSVKATVESRTGFASHRLVKTVSYNVW